jgi:pimeloyl-ACP methyl ester carboxylesterase
VAAALALASSGCAYLKWRKDRSAGLAELKKQPSLLLEKEVLPENCFVLVGGPEYGPGERPQVLAAALDHSHLGHELVGSREVTPDRRVFGMLLPAGSYDLLYFADLNDDGYYSTNEVVGRTAPETPVRVDDSASSDGVIVPAPPVPLDLAGPSRAETSVHVKYNPDPMVVASVAAPIFDPPYGELGVYQPTRFMATLENLVYSIGEPDFRKTQVVLVHGIDGTPRDFATLISSLDPSRYHVWLFYYPSGLPLDKLGRILAIALEKIAAAGPDGMRLALVAHSMGGLVGRRALNEVCRSGKPEYLRAYVSFDTPYGGVEAAAGAVKRGTELVASWIDIAAGSPFLTRLHETPLPDDLPFHLFFGWGLHGHHGPSPAGDGTIALASQLDPRAQEVATGMSGYGETHVGILSDKAALEELSGILDETCAAKKAAP